VAPEVPSADQPIILANWRRDNFGKDITSRVRDRGKYAAKAELILRGRP
jgi:hypothetical protein